MKVIVIKKTERSIFSNEIRIKDKGKFIDGIIYNHLFYCECAQIFGTFCKKENKVILFRKGLTQTFIFNK